MIESVIHEGGKVTFPAFNRERHYMIPFMQREGLPKELQHWQETVDDMLDGIKTHEPIYFMADQSYVHAGLTHRRPGVHVDGYWIADTTGHGGSGRHQGGVHRSRRPGFHSPGRHRGSGTHASGRWEFPDWRFIDFSAPEAILLASDVQGARAWTGLYNEQLIGDGGAADKVPTELMSSLDLKAGRVYQGNVATLHASVPHGESVYRSMVRLNCPGVSI